MASPSLVLTNNDAMNIQLTHEENETQRSLVPYPGSHS